MCEREREREKVCVREREREKERERERERETETDRQTDRERLENKTCVSYLMGTTFSLLNYIKKTQLIFNMLQVRGAK